MSHRPPSFLPVLPLILAGALPAAAEEWTRFRGPNGSGLSEARGIPTSWSESDYNWKAKLPGAGHSQPVLWGERIFLTSAVEEGARRIILCLRAADGGIEWSRELEARTHDKHLRNSYASGTPAVDEERAYFVFAHPEALALVAFDHQGGEKWRRDLGPFGGNHGHGASPIVFEELVVLPNEQEGKSSIIALDRKSGETRWQTERRTERVAYGTPCVHLGRDGEPELLFTSQAHGISSLDARSGRPLWEAAVFTMRTVSSPVLAGGLAVGTCGSGGGGNYLVAVRLGGEGDVASTHLAYKLSRSMPYVPTPIARGDRLFLWSDGGVVSCVRASSGEVIWQARAGGSYSGSPVCVEDRLYCISDEGDVVVVAAADEFRLLAKNPLGEPSRSTPAVAGGRMYLRTYSHLISIGGKASAATGSSD
jgi:outer membrane protein assembly factor BamB